MKKVFRRIASVLLVAAIAVSLCACSGGTSADDPVTLGSGSDFNRWFGEGKKLSKQESGTYYFKLKSDIKVTKEGVIANQAVVFDLNGYTITGEDNRVFSMGEGASLNLFGGTVQTEGADANGGVISVNGAGSQLVLENVTLSNTDDSKIADRLSGGVIYATTPADGAVTKIILRGDTVINGSKSGLRRNGGSVYLAGNTAMYLYGGAICDGKAGTSGNIHMDGKSALYMLGGEIRGGTAVKTSEITGFGGNVNVQTMGRIYMYAGTVTGGMADNAGGNIFISNTGTVDGESGLYFYGGVIRDGVTIAEGGNVYAAESNSVLRMYGGTLENGDAMFGGNVYVQSATLELRGTTFAGKSDSQRLSSGGNIYIANGELYLYDGLVEKGVSIYNGGNIYAQDTLVEIYGGVIADGVVTTASVGYGGGNLYAGKNSVVNMYGGEIYGGVANPLKDQEASAAGSNVMVGGHTKMQMFGGVIRDGSVYGKVTRAAGVYVYGQVKGNDAVFHMYGGTVKNKAMENTMRGNCIAAYSETSGDAGFGTARIFDGEVIFDGADNDKNRVYTMHGNKTNGRDLVIFNDAKYKGMYNRATVGACKDGTHNTVTGEVAATCLTHGCTEYTCGTCGVWYVITAAPTGHTEQTESFTTDEGVTGTRHSCTGCDAVWFTDVDASVAK